MIRVEDTGRIRVLTLDRPQARNAFDEAHYDELAAAPVSLLIATKELMMAPVAEEIAAARSREDAAFART